MDEWPISSARYVPDSKPVCVKQHRTVEDRQSACNSFIKMFDLKDGEFTMVLDGMDNGFQRLYGAWPLRFYGVHKGILEFKPQPSECTYSLTDFIAWMNSTCQTQT